MTRVSVAGTDVTVELREGESILAGLFRAGYAFRVGCRRGGCGICKVEILDGDIAYPVKIATQVLSEEERASGKCLACRAVPTTDTVIRLQSDDEIRRLAPFLSRLLSGKTT